MRHPISGRTALKLGTSTAAGSGLHSLAVAAAAPSHSLEGRISISLKGMKGTPMAAFEELNQVLVVAIMKRRFGNATRSDQSHIELSIRRPLGPGAVALEQT